LDVVGGQAIDRARFVRRAGLGAASLLPLVAAAEARAAADGGGFARHPRWRFVFIHHETTDPLFVATQFGAQDACALIDCDYRWLGSARGDEREAAKALRVAVREKASGIALSLPKPSSYTAAIADARSAGIPLLAFNVFGGKDRLAYVGQDHYGAGLATGKRLTSVGKGGEIVLVAPQAAPVDVLRRSEGVQRWISESAGSYYASTVYHTRSDRRPLERLIQDVYQDHPNLRALVALTRPATEALVTVNEQRGSKRVRSAGFDLLPSQYDAVHDGRLDFALDQQSYAQGFCAVMQLFLVRISEGLVRPSDVLIPPLFVDKSSVARYLKTKSRFEGSTSRQSYPLARA
jgi:simple sugar transport system substrate-binding protein